MIKSPLFLMTGLLVWATTAFAQNTNFWLFLCFGQSNMESGGRMEETDRTVDERFVAMADFDAPNRGWTKGNWYRAVPPLAAQGTGICLVDYFGRTMVANLPPNIRVGVIKVSVPGCKIELFQKNTFTNYVTTVPSWMLNYVTKYGGNPYQYLVDRAKLAQQDGVIKGILLHQGESNPNDHEWPDKVKGIYDNFIKDLNLKPEEVPFLAGETVNADQGGACAGFNKIMAELPKALPNSYVISSAGCTCNPDHMHFNAAGSRQFGTRYGEKMLAALGYKIKEPNPPSPAPAKAQSHSPGATAAVPASRKLKNDPIPSPGCGKELGDFKSGTYTIASAGLSRKYTIDIPANYDKNKPCRLIFAMHMMGGHMNTMVNNKFYGLKTYAERDNVPVIFVAPEGYTDGSPWRGRDDKDHIFFADMLALFKEELSVDTSRIFCCGFSFGAMVTYSLSLDFQNDLRAVACYAPANWNIYLPANKHEPVAFYSTTGTTDGLCRYVNSDARQQGGKYCVLTHIEDDGVRELPEIPLATTPTHVTTEFKGLPQEYPVLFGSFVGGHTDTMRDPGSNVNWIARETWDFFMRF